MAELGFDVDDLAQAVTGRQRSAFEDAVRALDDEARSTYEGARVLVTGAAGFIGGQTLRLLLARRPASVVLADSWENGLAEVVRDLRSSDAVAPGTRLEPRLVDVAGPLVERMVDDDGPFDAVLAFAAAKHVRTERDPVSALHLLNVNINGTYRPLRAAADANPACRLFMVSTDKAADPSSLMGASKRAMELLVIGDLPQTTTTRFANVAFSSGSLLESWLTRLARGQALPVPLQTSRFFVRPREAGQLCVLASLAPPGSVVVPAEGLIDELDLGDALERVLDQLGVPWVDASGDELVPRAPGSPVQVLRTPRDTAGEKAREVFVGHAEHREPWLPGVDRVVGTATGGDARELADWVVAAMHERPGPDLAAVLERVSRAVPEFHHAASSRRLDDRI